jgi:hypothetical protein
MPGEAASHLCQVITRRYEHGLIILTTNRGIAEWVAIFEDTTVAVGILQRTVWTVRRGLQRRCRRVSDAERLATLSLGEAAVIQAGDVQAAAPEIAHLQR